MEPLEFLTELRANSQGISPDSRSSDPSRAIRARSLPLAATALPVAARAYCAAMGNPASAARAVSTPVSKSTAPRAPTRSALEGRRPRPRPRPRAQAAAARPTTAHEAPGWSPPLHAHPRPNGCAAGDSAVQRCHVSHARRSADGHSISVRSHRPLPRFVLSGALGINRPQELRKPAVRCASLRDCRQHCRDRYRRREAAAHYDRRGRRRPWMLV